MATRRGQRGQALVEMAASSVVLILILLGILDLSRVFQFQTAMQEAAREGAREAVAYNGIPNNNPNLNQAAVVAVVQKVMKGAGIPTTSVSYIGGCSALSATGGHYNPPFGSSAYNMLAGVNKPGVFICANTETGDDAPASIPPNCQLPSNLAPNAPSCGGYDLEVAVLMKFGLIIQSGPFGPSLPVMGYAHMRVQGS